MNNLTFQQENDKVLSFMLDRKFFKKWKNPENNKIPESIELYITSECNLKCEYCYLAKRGDHLYPSEIRDHDTIISNLKRFLRWMINNDYQPINLDLFSGEIWGLDLGNRVLDTILEYIDNGFKVVNIMIPSNVTFILNDQKLDTIDSYIEEFQKRDVVLRFSASVDGLIIEENNRPFKDRAKNRLRDEEFYEKLFRWAKEHNYGFHPMVNANAMNKWIENYDWWVDMFHKHKFSFGRGIMLLEVRNDEWNDKNIREYTMFLNHVFDHFKKEVYHDDIRSMVVDLMRLLPHEKTILQNYCNIGLPCTDDRFSCSISRNLTIRLGDLSIVPCHRLSYDKFINGRFIIKDDEIIGIQSGNINFSTQTWVANTRTSTLKCDTCKNNNFCLFGCVGSQFEATGDPFIPIESVCNMAITKTDFLIKKYANEGLLDVLESYDFGDMNKLINSHKVERAIKNINKFQRSVK